MFVIHWRKSSRHQVWHHHNPTKPKRQTPRGGHSVPFVTRLVVGIASELRAGFIVNSYEINRAFSTPWLLQCTYFFDFQGGSLDDKRAFNSFHCAQGIGVWRPEKSMHLSLATCFDVWRGGTWKGVDLTKGELEYNGRDFYRWKHQRFFFSIWNSLGCRGMSFCVFIPWLSIRKWFLLLWSIFFMIGF